MRRYFILTVLLALFLGLTIWMTALGSVGIFKMAPPSKVLTAAIKHLQIVGAAEALAIIFGIPIGFLSTRRAFRFICPVLIGTAMWGRL